MKTRAVNRDSEVNSVLGQDDGRPKSPQHHSKTQAVSVSPFPSLAKAPPTAEVFRGKNSAPYTATRGRGRTRGALDSRRRGAGEPVVPARRAPSACALAGQGLSEAGAPGGGAAGAGNA